MRDTVAVHERSERGRGWLAAGRGWLLLVLAAELLYLFQAHLVAASPRSTHILLPWGFPLGAWSVSTPDAAAAWHAVSMAALMGLYAAQLRKAQSGGGPGARLLFGAAALHGITLLCAPGLLSSELLNDMGHGRVLAHYGANPFETPASTFPPDDITGAMGRSGTPPAAGPVWISLASLLALAGGGAFVPTLLLFKIAALAAHLINARLILAIVSRWPRAAGRLLPESAALFYLWNPLLMSQSAGDGRHEVFALTGLLFCLWLLQRADPLMAGASLMMALLVDYVMLPVGGLVLAQRARMTEGGRAGIFAGAMAVAGAIAFAPYIGGVGWQHFLPPYWLPAEPAGLLVAVEIALAAALGSASPAWMPTLAMWLWGGAAAAAAIWWILAAARVRRLEAIPDPACALVCLLLVTGAAAFQLPALGWAAGLAALGTSPALRRAAFWLCVGGVAVQTLGLYRAMLGTMPPPLPGARLIVSLVAAIVPGIYLVLHARDGRAARGWTGRAAIP